MIISAFIPLCENMCSGTATRPGDVVTARNGKTIQVNSTEITCKNSLILTHKLYKYVNQKFYGDHTTEKCVNQFQIN